MPRCSRLLLVLCAVVTALAMEATGSTLVHAQTINQFVNSWTNIDSNTPGITRILIGPSGSTSLTIHAYGKCHPTDCDWGTVTGSYQNGTITAVYSPGFVVRRLTMVLQNGRLVVTDYDHFTDNSGRTDQTNQYTFGPASPIPAPTNPSPNPPPPTTSSPPSQNPQPAAAPNFTDNIWSDQSTYTVGDIATICWEVDSSVSGTTTVRVTRTDSPSGTAYGEFTFPLNQPQCTTGPLKPPPGRRAFSMIVLNINGQWTYPNQTPATTSYTVVAASSQPTSPSQPQPTAAPPSQPPPQPSSCTLVQEELFPYYYGAYSPGLAIFVVETGQQTTANYDGNWSVSLPGAGTYTVITSGPTLPKQMHLYAVDDGCTVLQETDFPPATDTDRRHWLTGCGVTDSLCLNRYLQAHPNPACPTDDPNAPLCPSSNFDQDVRQALVMLLKLDGISLEYVECDGGDLIACGQLAASMLSFYIDPAGGDPTIDGVKFGVDAIECVIHIDEGENLVPCISVVSSVVQKILTPDDIDSSVNSGATSATDGQTLKSKLQ